MTTKAQRFFSARMFRRSDSILLAVFGLGIGVTASVAHADQPGDSETRAGRFCSATAESQFQACRFETSDDLYKTNAICINLDDEDEREQCSEDAEDAYEEGRELCRAQRTARKDLCREIGEARYAPDFEPELFDDDFVHPTRPNPYFPLTIGNVWQFDGGDETVRIEVLAKTKNVDGVTCIVVNDLVVQDGEPVEDTDDWFGLRLNGSVDYCGESVRDYAVFEGDNPQEPELIDIGGSFKAGRDGAKSGTQFLGTPRVGAVYRQEMALGEAEDAAKVVSIDYGYGDNAALDQFAPRALVELLCADNCVVNKEFSPMAPGGFQYKYYARGIGLFLEVNPLSGNVTRLVDCNFDVRCKAL